MGDCEGLGDHEFDSRFGDEDLSEVHDCIELDVGCMELECTDLFIDDESHPGHAILGNGL